MNIYRFVADGYLTYASAIDKLSGWYLRHNDRDIIVVVDVSELERLLLEFSSEQILIEIGEERSKYKRG